MHRFAALVTAVASCLVASSAIGGFTFREYHSYLGGNLQRIDLYALNTGHGTGSGLQSVDLNASAYAGNRIFFRSTSAGNPNLLNTADVVNRSFFRIDEIDSSTTTITSRSPAGNWPLAPDIGPNTVGQEDFSVAYESNAGAVPANTGRGALFASLIVGQSYTADYSGTVTSDTGVQRRFNFFLASDWAWANVYSPPPVTVNFGANTGASAAFSATVTATADGFTDGSGLNMTFDYTPAGITDLAATPTVGTSSPTTFTVTGRVSAELIGTTVEVPVFVWGTEGWITLHVVPEPSTLGLCLAGLLIARRRRA